MATLPVQQGPTFTRAWRALAIGGGAAIAGAALIGGIFLFRAGDSADAPTLSEVASPLGSRPTTPAIDQLRARIERDPADVASMTALANLYLQRVRETGDPALYGSAEALLTKAAALAPEDADVIAAQASLALGRHQFREALSFANRAVAIDPERARYYGLRADAEIELGMYDEAVGSLQEMVDRRPDFTAFARIAHARELFGDPEGAIESMLQALEAGTGTPENLAWAHTELGRLYFGFARFEDAAAENAKALAIYPGYHVALAGQAEVAAARGDLAGAAALYEQAAAFVPLPGYAIALGDIATARGEVAEAQRQYALVDSINQLFVAAGANSDPEVTIFQADHGADPQATVARARMAYADQPNIHAAGALAWALYKAGAIDEARQYAGEALRLGTLDPLMLYHAGVIAAAAGERDEARTLLEDAVRFNPKFSVLVAPAAATALAALQ